VIIERREIHRQTSQRSGVKVEISSILKAGGKRLEVSTAKLPRKRAPWRASPEVSVWLFPMSLPNC